MNLIDKAALVAEIERRIKSNAKEMYFGRLVEDNYFFDFINTIEVKEVGVDFGDPKGDKSAKCIIDTKTIEVKEVDLDFHRFAEEIETVFALPSSKTKNTEEEPLNWEYAIAKHFYSLGLAQKGEKV